MKTKGCGNKQPDVYLDGVVRAALAGEMMYKLNHLKNRKQNMPGMGSFTCRGPDGGKIQKGLWYIRASVDLAGEGQRM